MVTLTAKEIYDLACFAGFTINHNPKFMPDELGMEAEYTIEVCPEGGVRNDEGKIEHYGHIATLTEYPDEGVCPLGEPLSVDG